jgi:hypothetical protein
MSFRGSEVDWSGLQSRPLQSVVLEVFDTWLLMPRCYLKDFERNTNVSETPSHFVRVLITSPVLQHFIHGPPFDTHHRVHPCRLRVSRRLLQFILSRTMSTKGNTIHEVLDLCPLTSHLTAFSLLPKVLHWHKWLRECLDPTAHSALAFWGPANWEAIECEGADGNIWEALWLPGQSETALTDFFAGLTLT